MTASEADLAQRINAMAARYRMSREKMRQELEQRQALDDIRGQVRIDKTLDWLVTRLAGAEGIQS